LLYLRAREEDDFGGHVGREGIKAGERHADSLIELEVAHLGDGEGPGTDSFNYVALGRVCLRFTGIDVKVVPFHQISIEIGPKDV
jgi:hypothetical protein